MAENTDQNAAEAPVTEATTKAAAGKKAAKDVATAALAAAADVADAATAAATEVAATVTSRFGKAIEDAKASAEGLKGEALERTAAAKDKVAGVASDWTEQAGLYAEQAKEKSLELAKQGKTKASDALTAIGKTISGSAATIDEKLGVQYGDYARSAARTIQESAARLEAKDFSEIGEDMTNFVKKSPATALGIAAVTGFMLARLLRGSDSSDA